MHQQKVLSRNNNMALAGLSRVFAISLVFTLVVATLDRKTVEFLKKIVELHERQTYAAVPLSASAFGNSFDVLDDNNAFLPGILIWEPDAQFKITLPCFEQGCRGTIRGREWTDGSKQRLHPRTIHHINGICLVLTRIYHCSQSSMHIYVGTHTKILEKISEKTITPFLIRYRSGITRELFCLIPVLVRNGLSFIEIENTLRDMRREHYCDKQIRFLTRTSFSTADDSSCLPSYKDTPLSNDLLSNFFIYYYSMNEEVFNEDMRKLSASWLCCDHTFKVATNIGLMRDGKWIKQYDSLFAVMNEHGQVLAWQLVYGQAYVKIENVLIGLKNRLCKQNAKLQGICIDNCCYWKGKLQGTFGNDVLVKLDIFHAIQRLSKVLSSKHPLYWRCLKDFSLVFRASGDQGEERTKPTPEPQIMLKNFLSFRKKWQGSSHDGKNIITEAAMKELDKIAKHIEKGCLSGIPVGIGTNRNENMHRSLNKDLKRNRLGVFLAVALLSTFFHSWNQRDKKAPYKTVTEKWIERRLKGAPPPSTTETFGIGISAARLLNDDFEFGTAFNERSDGSDLASAIFQEMSQLPPCDQELQDGLSPREILTILYNSICTLQVLQSIESLSKTHTFNARDIGFMDSVPQMFYVPETEGYEVYEEHEQRLNQVLAEYNLTRVPVAGDGNCLISAIMFDVSSRLANATEGDNLLQHLEQIGIDKNTTADHASVCLRKLMVAEWLQNESYYLLRNLWNGKAEELLRFQEKGVYRGELGNAMPLALANVLNLPIILFASMDNFPVVVLTPRTTVANSTPVYLAFNQSGGGHYDAVAEACAQTKESQEHSKSDDSQCGALSEEIKCRCGRGRNRQDTEKKRCLLAKCGCFNNKQGCSQKCGCNHCGNTYGTRPLAPSSGLKKSRKRPLPDTNKSAKASKAFMLEKKESVRYGTWTDIEHCTFIALLHYLRDNGADVSSSVIYSSYNTVARYVASKESLAGFPLAVRSQTEIDVKLRQHNKEGNVFGVLLSRQAEIGSNQKDVISV